MNRDEHRELSKEELVELVLKLQRPTKTSRTSSKPPSTDRKEKRAGSKPGGAKPGHKGHFRPLTEDPDHVVEHRPERCSGCGHAFAPDAAGEVIGAFDSVDLPPVMPVVTRHQRLACTCPGCGARVKSCFQPIQIYDAATAKPVAFLLRPGRRPSGVEAARVLRHVIGRIRTNWPRVAITVRGDGHYGTPEVMDLLERTGCSYILGLPTNARLKDIAHPWCEDAATRRALVGKPKARRFFQTFYAARSWSRERRIIARVEATAMGADVRFIVTNLTGRSKHLYEKCYCARGRMENLIKEHKLYTKSDRTSCHRWEANQFRLMLHTAAYWLLHKLRGAAPKRFRWRTATFETIRRSFLKIAVRVEQLKTRIRLSLPSACPHALMITLMLGRIHAQSP